MRTRHRRLATLIAAAVSAMIIVTAASATTDGHGHPGLARCLREMTGGGATRARAVPGSADPQVLAQFAVLRQARTAADRLPAVSGLQRTLTAAHVTSYDLAAAVRLRSEGQHGGVYAVPATVSTASAVAACADLAPPGERAEVASSLTDTVGNGPGACVIEIGRFVVPPTLPGRPSRSRTIVGLYSCESDAVLTGYVGATGFGGGPPLLIPDGVSRVTYTWSDGRSATEPVSGNVVQSPVDPLSAGLIHSAAQLAARLRAALPATITEAAASGAPVSTLALPPTLISDTVGNYRFLHRVVAAAGTGSTGTFSATSSSTTASCSARTHRCVAVVLTQSCHHHDRCELRRAIRRYRYVGRRPPRGTTAPQTQATGPILARINRLVRRPRRMTLVLTGATRRPVKLLQSVTCLGPHNTAIAGSSPVLQVAVPSRTPIRSSGGSVRACAVGVLVVGSRHEAVHARLEVTTRR